MATETNQLEALYIQLRAALTRKAVASGAQAADAEDHVHDSFVKAASVLDLSEVSDPAAYLSAVVRNSVVARLRRDIRLKRLAPALVVSETESDTAADFADRVLVDSLEGVVASLKPGYRRLLQAIAMGRTSAQIAAELGDSKHAVQCEITRAKHALRKELRRRHLAPGFTPPLVVPHARLRLQRFGQQMSSLWRDPTAIAAPLAFALVIGTVPTTIGPPRENGPQVPSGGGVANGSISAPIATATSSIAQSRILPSWPTEYPRERRNEQTIVDHEGNRITTWDDNEGAPPPLQDQVGDAARHYSEHPEDVQGPWCEMPLGYSCDRYPLDPHRT